MSVHRSTVAVCICTYRRPEILAGLLDRLVVVAAADANAAEVSVVVVDDDPAGSARGVAEARADRFEGGLAYAVTGSGNISRARNRALAEGADRAEWLALIDDDCMPDPGWLRELLSVAARHDAELVTGACVDVVPPGSPRWLTDQPFLDSSPDEPDGAIREVGHLKNSLVSAAALARHDLRFDETFGREGGEDVMFFYTAAARGVRHHFAARARVEEQVPASRTTYRYMLWRRFWYGTTESRTSVAAGRYPRWRMGLSGVKLAALAPARAVARLLARRPPQLRWTLAEAAQGVGRTAGALGLRIAHR